MEENAFNEWIRIVRDRTVPPAPAPLDARVLRRVRSLARGDERSPSGWLGPLLTPRTMAWVSLAALAVSIGSTLITLGLRQGSASAAQAAAHALDFESFRSVEMVSFFQQGP